MFKQQCKRDKDPANNQSAFNAVTLPPQKYFQLTLPSRRSDIFIIGGVNGKKKVHLYPPGEYDTNLATALAALLSLLLLSRQYMSALHETRRLTRLNLYNLGWPINQQPPQSTINICTSCRCLWKKNLQWLIQLTILDAWQHRNKSCTRHANEITCAKPTQFKLSLIAPQNYIHISAKNNKYWHLLSTAVLCKPTNPLCTQYKRWSVY